MDEEELKNYEKAGKIAKEIREWSKSLIKPGKKLLEVAEEIENKIKESGADPAFPVNICVNDVAAHYTPKFNDNLELGENDIVSIDIGVHVNGYIADTAYTIDLSNSYKDMLKCNQEALKEAISLISPDTSVSEIGKVVEDVTASYGYKPIENLTGHQIERYNLHAGISIPNIEVPYDWKIKEGMVLAIEPFATDGYGRVLESKIAEIFSLKAFKSCRLKEGRLLLKKLEPRKGLPFAKRWFSKDISPLKLDLVLRELVAIDAIKPYFMLHEKERGKVSQFEHTVIVLEDGCKVIT
ncbi:MAG TPA: type II methionyl aminopeptidase [Candidatus Altiarchaeales archaeon]|nr:type II methionyl aminopeptidase [Candidatus Altiarchaeales archaeon]